MIENTRTRLTRFTAARFLPLALWLLAAPVLAQPRVPMTFGEIEITMQNPPQGSSSHGYGEYVFRVRNLSRERPFTVGLNIPSDTYFHRGDTLRALRRTVRVGANETVRLTLLQPDHPPIDGSNVAVFIDGQRRDRELSLRPLESNSGHRFYRGRYFSFRPSTDPPLLLIGNRVAPLPMQTIRGGGMAFPAGGGGGMPMGGAGAAPAGPPGAAGDESLLSLVDNAVPGVGSVADLLLAGEMGEVEIAENPLGKLGLPPNSHQPVNHEPVETWSNNWLAYTRYDGVLVTADELKTMPTGVRTALWQYVEAGGFLLVMGPADLRGLSAVAETETDKDGWKTVYAGFGKCLVSPDAKYDKWDDKNYENLSKAWATAAAPWSGGDQRSTADANLEFPVVEDLGVPVKGLFVLMFLFALGIGPINLIILTRFKRRIWLLWTTPVFSLLTCLAVFGFMLISEGWQGRLRIETLTLLDETTHRATTIGWTGVYTPLTPSDGLHFSYETEVIPQRFFEGEGGGARFCTIDWTQDQHFASGWVEARVPALFKVRKSELSHKGITLYHEADGSWSMVNGLGAAIRRFWYADDKGQIHTAEDIAAGAKTRLTRTEKEIPAKPKGWNLSSFIKWMTRMKEVAEKPESFLRPGNYLAEMDDSPFLNDDVLRNAKKRKEHALIVGFRQRSD